jgi:hypothetical protein
VQHVLQTIASLSSDNTSATLFGNQPHK